MRYAFNVHAHPMISMLGMAATRQLSAAWVERMLGATTVRSITPCEHGGYVIDLDRTCESDGAGLSEIAEALTSLGLDITQMAVGRVANRAVEMAFVGLVGGGSAASRARHPVAALTVAVLGTLVGAAIGAQIRAELDTRPAQCDPYSNIWS